MSYLVLAARILHVGCGAFWAGSMIFVAAFLVPALGEAGPDGAKVMGGLARRNFMVVVPIMAILTILSGFYLYWYVSAGFAPAYMGSMPGKVYGFGAVAALAAFGIGIGVVRPSMTRAMALSAQAGADPTQRDRLPVRRPGPPGPRCRGGSDRGLAPGDRGGGHGGGALPLSRPGRSGPTARSPSRSRIARATSGHGRRPAATGPAQGDGLSRAPQTSG